LYASLKENLRLKENTQKQKMVSNKYSLTSTLGEVFVCVIYIIGSGFLGFLIYSVVINEMSAILTCLALNIFLYFIFIKKILKFKKITFDTKSIYLDDECISLKQVKNIKIGELIIRKNEKEIKINYNYFYSENFRMLKEFYEAENKS
jgi:hypothetical protein